MRQVLVFLTIAMFMTGCGLSEVGEACQTSIYEETDCVEAALCVPNIAQVSDEAGLANYWWTNNGPTTETNEDGTETTIAAPELLDPNVNQWGSERSFTCRQQCNHQTDCTESGFACLQVFGTTTYACQPINPTAPATESTDSES